MSDQAHALEHGSLDLVGRLPGSSNAAMMCLVEVDGSTVRCVYKPIRGERPLWDFPEGTLAAREVAAYRLTTIVGWPLIPTTVWREDGPFGPGMCQLWVEESDDVVLVDIVPAHEQPPGWRHVVTGQGDDGSPVTLVHADRADLRRMAVLDALLNNADRKAGHLLLDAAGALWGIDHGVTFNEEHKLRTVLWGWAGEPIDRALLAAVEAALDDWGRVESALDPLLDSYEVIACRERFVELVRDGTYPVPLSHWPAIPWPLF